MNPNIPPRKYIDRHPDAERPTDGQLQILQLIANGLRNQPVADQLGLSLETVKTHVRRNLSTLGARNRTEAVAIAIRKGWIE